MHLVYIHGNRSTSTSFNYMRSGLRGHTDILLDYDSRRGFYANHHTMLEHLDGLSDIFFIAHSLGGIHALHLASELKGQVLGGVTMSTPYGGSGAATMMSYLLPFNQVLKDIQPQSRPITAGRNIELNIPWTNLVSTTGESPFIMAANDGVVTQHSMRYHNDIRTIDIDCNHFEILLNPEALDIVRREVEEAQRALSRRIVLSA